MLSFSSALRNTVLCKFTFFVGLYQLTACINNSVFAGFPRCKCEELLFAESRQRIMTEGRIKSKLISLRRTRLLCLVLFVWLPENFIDFRSWSCHCCHFLYDNIKNRDSFRCCQCTNYFPLLHS